MNTLVSDNGLQALQDAMRSGSDAVAVRLFRQLVGTTPMPDDVVEWIEKAWRAFDQDDGGVPADAIGMAGADEVAVLLVFARVAFGAGHASTALEAARRAMVQAPDRAEPAFLLCALLLRTGGAQAHALLQHCLQRFPLPSQGWTTLGALLLGKGKREAALVCFARGVVGFATAMRRGLLARDLGRRSQARDAFAEAVRQDPTSTRAWFLLGTCAQDDRDFEAAATAYRTVLSLAPTVAEAAVNLGTVLQETGDLPGAKAVYGRAVMLQPSTFGRVAQALATSPAGELWLDLEALRHSLAR